MAHAVLMPGFAGTSAPPWLRDAIDRGLGGVCYFGHNIESASQVAGLSAQIHAAGPVLIATDEEGGIVTRLHAREGSPHVGAATLGRADDLVLTRQVARLIADEVRAAGIDIDLAPVADVNSDPANPVIGVRAFGAEPSLVGRHVAGFVTELQANGVAACAKHFPGHGDTHVDSHVGLPTVEADLSTLWERELVPFAAAIDAGVECVMTAHAIYPALDDVPATISPAAIALLRDELGFDGVILSDAIDMKAISGTIGCAEGVVRALIAGVDLIALGNPVLGKTDASAGLPADEMEFSTARDAILAALDNGRLTTDRLAVSAMRIRALAATMADRRQVFIDGAASPAADARAAALSLRIRGDVAGALKAPVHIVDVRRQRNIASGRLTSLLADEILASLPGSTAESVFAAGGVAEGRVMPGDGHIIRQHVQRADVIVTGTPGQDPEERAILDEMLNVNPDAVVVCLGWSSDPADIAAARNVIFTFGDSRPTARAVVDLLTP